LVCAEVCCGCCCPRFRVSYILPIRTDCGFIFGNVQAKLSLRIEALTRLSQYHACCKSKLDRRIQKLMSHPTLRQHSLTAIARPFLALMLGTFSVFSGESSGTALHKITAQDPPPRPSAIGSPVAPPPAAEGEELADGLRLSSDNAIFNPGANGVVRAIIVQRDEKIVVAGDFLTLGGLPRNHIGRLYPDGTVDPNFNPGANGNIYELVLQPDGKILVGGDFTTLGGGGTGTTACNHIGRLNSDGTLDTRFFPSANGFVSGLALQADGKMVVGGGFTTLGTDTLGNPFSRNSIGRLNADGYYGDDAFNPGANNSVFKVALQPDGKIVLAGAFTMLGGGGIGNTSRSYVGRVNQDGSLDISFNPGANNFVDSVLRQSDGKIVVGGLFTALGGGTGTTPRQHLGRINSDGSIENTFNPGANNRILCLAQQSDGKLLVGGNFTTLGGGGTGINSRNFIGRLNTDGSLDTSFNPGVNGGIAAITPRRDGTILVGGNFNNLSGSTRNGLGLLNSDGTINLTVFPTNGSFTNGQTLSGSSGITGGVNAGANIEMGEPNHAGNRGGASVWYRWVAPFTGPVLFSTFGSDFDTLLFVYTGSNVNALSAVASNDDVSSPDVLGHLLTSRVTFNALTGTTYFIAVDGSQGRTGAFTLGWGPESSLGGQVSLGTGTSCSVVNGKLVCVAVPSVAQVWITLTGEDSRSVTFNGNGNYSFQHLRVGGHYTVRIKGDTRIGHPCILDGSFYGGILQFLPLTGNTSNANFTDSGCSVVGAGTASGYISTATNVGITGVTVTARGPATRAETTDAGSYQLSNLPLGVYSVTPSSEKYTFTPTSKNVNLTDNTLIGVDFAAKEAYAISGQVKLNDGTPVIGVVVTISGSLPRTALTGADGYYSLYGAAGENSTITVSKPTVAFIQPSLTLQNLTANQKNIDFVVAAAVTIRGRLRNVNQRGLSGETVNLSGSSNESATTDANGDYSFTVASGGSYNVAPADSRVSSWLPDNSRTYTNITQSISTADFEARFPSFTVAGVVKNSGGTTFSGVKVRLNGTNLTTKDYTTDSNGSYTSDQLNILGDYTFTPQGFAVSGTTYNSFNPSNRSFVSMLTCALVPGATCANNSSTNNYLGIDFTVLPSPTVATNPASSITATSATLNGTVNPNGLSTNAWFEWGTDPTLTVNTATTQQARGAGTSSQAFTQNLSGLAGGTTYYFRAVAASSSGTVKGTILTYSTISTGPVQVTVQTNPVGRSFIVDGTAYNTTQILTWTSGSLHSLNTTSLQNGDPGTRYVWTSWSDNNPISHNVTAPNGNITYTANFFTQHMLSMNAGTGGTISPGSGFFNSALTVSIAATPDSGFVFVGWTGSGAGSFTGSTNSVNVTMNGPITQTANFAPINPQWQPVALTTQQIADIKAWTVAGRTYVYVKPQFPDAGYRVMNWGQAVRTVNDFTADASVEKFTGPSIQAAVTTAQIYDLGPLANGTYNFNFKTSGTLAKALQFTVSSTVPPPNPIDDARQFVKQQYRDFLNREADPAGEDFWTDNINKCSDPLRRPAGQTIEQCTLRQRETTSGAFFQSPEFQYTGYYVYRMYQGALGRQPKLSEFIPDAQFVGNGIVVNGQLSGAKINQNKAAFAALFVNCTDATKYRCSEFKALYDGLNNQQYVDKLFLTTGVNASATDRAVLVNGLNGGTETRASVVQKVVDGITVIAEGNQQFTTTYGQAFYNSEFNRAFVQLQYFGYMKRDPDDAGYAFWLGKLNQFGGNFVNAEMVLAFISSPEYRSRFGQP
jgi:uncharacterized delta-60 repeat protein/uncharacterized repeat protein (TIGR02543 family)